MAAIAFGVGLSGLVMNIMRIATIGAGLAARGQSDGKSVSLLDTLIFYAINCIFQLIACSLYFVEKRQPLARYVNEKVWE